MSEKVFVIAEAGLNHMGDLNKARDLIEAAQQAGADAVKFQTYDTSKRVSPNSPIYDLLKQCELSYEQFRDLKDYADTLGIELFSTPFDLGALKFLVEDLGLRRVKIASFDVTNTAFLRQVNEYATQFHDYNVILSTGMSDGLEISEAVKALDKVALLTLLHCKSSYPLRPQDANLGAINSLKYNFWKGSRKIGYSCHTKDFYTPAAAVLVGAQVIEKHFMVYEDDQVVDAPVSLCMADFQSMVQLIRQYEEMLGDGELGQADCEAGALSFRRRS